jgi:DNA-binding response OmpR family regulator
MTKLLLVEDDIRIANLISAFLVKQGFEVTTAASVQEARQIASVEHKLFILDLMLPDGNGVELAKELNSRFTTPTLMLTAVNEELQEIEALDAGIDDYLTKPIQPQRLLARIKALLRRQALTSPVSIKQNLQIDEVRREVFFQQELLSLTDSEFDLLLYFYKNPDRKVSRDELITALRGFEYDGVDRSIDMRVSALRKKLNDDNPPYRYIKTIRGFGYLFAFEQAEQ